MKNLKTIIDQAIAEFNFDTKLDDIITNDMINAAISNNEFSLNSFRAELEAQAANYELDADDAEEYAERYECDADDADAVHSQHLSDEIDDLCDAIEFELEDLDKNNDNDNTTELTIDNIESTRTQEIINLTQQVENLKSQIQNKNDNKYYIQVGNDSICDEVYTYAEVQDEIIDSLEYEIELLRDNDKLDICSVWNIIDGLQRGECIILTVYDMNDNKVDLCNFFEFTSPTLNN